MLGVVACVLAVVCKRMQQLSTSLGPAVHRGKNTTHKSLKSMRNECAWPQQCWKSFANGSNIVALRFGDHGTKEMLGVGGWKVWPVSNFAQRHATTSNSMQRGVETDATCNIQQCWELLANNVASVCTGLKTPNVLQSSSLLFSITSSSSFSVIHVSVNIKNNVEKDTTLLLFFLSKSPGGHRRPCDFFPLHLGCHTCWLNYLTLVCGADGRSGGRAVGVRSRDYQIFSDR